jgi:hypothetical protein
MKHLKTLILLLIAATSAKAQAFQPKWCIIQKKASYTILFPSFKDAELIGSLNVEKNDMAMAAGEVVLAFDKKEGLTYCFDPFGRMVVFKGDSSLLAAPVSNIASVGLILKDIEMLEGRDLLEGFYVWVIGQDVSKNTIKVMLDKGRVLDIPKDSIQLFSKKIRTMSKEDEDYRLIED